MILPELTPASDEMDVRRAVWDVIATSGDAAAYLNDCVLGVVTPDWGLVAAAQATLAALNAIHWRWIADHAAPLPPAR